MNYKFKIGDPVIYREDPNDKKPFDFDYEPIYIVYAYIAEHPHLNKYDKKVLPRKGVIYQISEIDDDCGSGYLSNIHNVSENQLTLYTENNEDVLMCVDDARQDLMERMKNGTLRKLEYKNCIAWRSPTCSNIILVPQSREEIKQNNIISYKFNIGNIVVFRNDSLDKSPFNINKDSLYIIYNYTENDSHFSSYGRRILKWEKKWRYEISKIEKGSTFGNFDELDYASEDQLIKYEGKNKETLELIKEAKYELERRYQSHSLYRRHAKKL